jgi:hypothetical protein
VVHAGAEEGGSVWRLNRRRCNLRHPSTQRVNPRRCDLIRLIALRAMNADAQYPLPFGRQCDGFNADGCIRRTDEPACQLGLPRNCRTVPTWPPAFHDWSLAQSKTAEESQRRYAAPRVPIRRDQSEGRRSINRFCHSALSSSSYTRSAAPGFETSRFATIIFERGGDLLASGGIRRSPLNDQLYRFDHGRNEQLYRPISIFGKTIA